MDFVKFLMQPYVCLGRKWFLQQDNVGNYWHLFWRESTQQLIAAEYNSDGYTGDYAFLGEYVWDDIKDIVGVGGGILGLNEEVP